MFQIIQNSIVDMNLMWIQIYKEILILAGALSEIRPFADLPFDQKVRDGEAERQRDRETGS